MLLCVNQLGHVMHPYRCGVCVYNVHVCVLYSLGQSDREYSNLVREEGVCSCRRGRGTGEGLIVILIIVAEREEGVWSCRRRQGLNSYTHSVRL